MTVLTMLKWLSRGSLLKLGWDGNLMVASLLVVPTKPSPLSACQIASYRALSVALEVIQDSAHCIPLNSAAAQHSSVRCNRGVQDIPLADRSGVRACPVIAQLLVKTPTRPPPVRGQRNPLPQLPAPAAQLPLQTLHGLANVGLILSSCIYGLELLGFTGLHSMFKWLADAHVVFLWLFGET